MKALATLMRLRTLAAVVAMGSLLIACDSLLSPRDGDGMYVRGTVSDAAFRPLAGVQIEVLDGKHAGATASSTLGGTCAGRGRGATLLGEDKYGGGQEKQGNSHSKQSSSHDEAPFGR